MRTFLCYIFLVTLFSSCTRTEDPIFINPKDIGSIYLNIKDSVWFTSVKWITPNVNGFATVKLVISGSTNAEYVTVKTYGDGVISDFPIDLGSNQTFSKDTVTISFIHLSGSPPVGEFESSTVVKAFYGTDTVAVDLKSGKLKY